MADDAKRILVVDDEPDAVAGITAMLQAGGYSVSSASDGEAGIAAARAEMPDLIILDVQMPGKSGFDTFSDLARDESTKGIPVCFLTGITETTGLKFSADDIGEFYGAQPEGYIEKPVDAGRLLSTVEKILSLR